VSALPAVAAWRGAAACHDELFAALDPGARIGLVARETPASMLLWEVGNAGIEVREAPFPGFSASGADVLLAADADALAKICAAADKQLFEVLRAGIRSGAVVCYILRRRCDLEERGFDELLDALGFAFMGACR
jgi:hypothetical protein